MKTAFRCLATTLLLSCLALFTGAQTPMDYNIMVNDIEIAPGVTIDININVYVNEGAHNWADHGKIIAVEGMAHTANCWKPLAEALFERSDPQLEINEFYAIDMPGRGLSGLPEGGDFLLEDMYFEHYLKVIMGALSYLNAGGVHPGTIMGHSLGGLEVILFQQSLVQQGSDLRKAFKIKNAVLLAPAIPAPLQWSFLGVGAAQLLPYAHYVPGYGLILDVPFYVWPYLFFTNQFYLPPAMVPGAPTPPEVLANGYNSIEAGPLLLQMGGIMPPDGYPFMPRISADSGLFTPSNGVQLTIVADEYDRMMQPAEEESLYAYLTGDERLQGFRVVMGDGTCHDTHIADPHAIVALLDMPYLFKSGGNVSTADVPGSGLSVSPNPSSESIHISFTLDREAEISLILTDCRGVMVGRFLSEVSFPAGRHQVHSNIGELPAGIYFCTLMAKDNIATVKLVVH